MFFIPLYRLEAKFLHIVSKILKTHINVSRLGCSRLDLNLIFLFGCRGEEAIKIDLSTPDMRQNERNIIVL